MNESRWAATASFFCAFSPWSFLWRGRVLLFGLSSSNRPQGRVCLSLSFAERTIHFDYKHTNCSYLVLKFQFIRAALTILLAFGLELLPAHSRRVGFASGCCGCCGRERPRWCKEWGGGRDGLGGRLKSGTRRRRRSAADRCPPTGTRSRRRVGWCAHGCPAAAPRSRWRRWL